jgi:hypothetical protein
MSVPHAGTQPEGSVLTFCTFLTKCPQIGVLARSGFASIRVKIPLVFPLLTSLASVELPSAFPKFVLISEIRVKVRVFLSWL